MILKKNLSLIIFIFCLLIMFNGISGDLEAKVAEISGIEVKEVDNYTEIYINTTSPLLSYTIYKPEDPYKVVVELQGVELGKLRDKIVIDRAGVMEIVPSKIEGRLEAVRLEIMFTVPAEVTPIQREDALILTFYNPEAEEVVTVPKEEVEEAELLPEEEVMPEEIGLIEDIKMVKSEERVDILIVGDMEMSPKVFEIDNNRLVVDIPNVLSAVESFDKHELPLLGVRIGEQVDRTRIVFDLLEDTEYEVLTKGNQIRVSFAMPKVREAKVVEEVPPVEPEIVPEEVPPVVPEVAPEEKIPPKEEKPEPFTTKEYVGEKISIDFQDVELTHVFRLLADVSGYNIVVSPQVTGKFSMRLIDVPWDQALDIILRNYGLSKSIEGNIIRIAPTSVMAQEEEEIAKAKEAKIKAGDLETRIYPVNYADVKMVEKVITDAKIMTKRGYVSVDERTSTIIIRDVAHMHKEIEKIIKSLDKPTPQVNIEAKIVEVSTNFTRELGIQWGTLWKPTPQTQIGGTSLSGDVGFFSGNPLMVNLPAAVGTGAGGVVGFGYISAKDLRALDIQLSAMESSGKGKIISNPRITTLDNQEAIIQQGKKIPYQSIDAQGNPKTEFIDAALELKVIPHITPENTIVMDIDIKKNEADFSQTGAGGEPTIDTKEAKTEVLIKDGDTLVIGGIFKTNYSKSMAGVPGLSKIPILGWLFKKKKVTEDTTELLIFITPRIVR
jgi:type IV pilus assembly protein PilQ